MVKTRVEMATAVAEDIIVALEGNIPTGAVNYIM